MPETPQADLSDPPELPGVSHRYVSVDGVRLHVAEAGNGPPLILIHGWPQHWWMWRDLIGPLAEDYRVLCPDLRGFGWSDIPRTGYGVERLTADVLAIADQLEIGRFQVIGHDVGLGIGYWLGLFHPDRVERCVVMSAWHLWAAASPSLGMFIHPWHMTVLASPLGAAAVRRGMPERALRRWRRRGTFSPLEVETYTSPLRRPGAAAATVQRYRRQLLEILWFTRRHRQLRLTVPTLQLVGERDPIIDVRPTQHLTTHATDYELAMVPDCGHFPVEEQTQWTLARLRSFLQTAD